MATTTIYCNKDARIATRVSDGWDAGAGVSDALPVGYWSGYKYRTLLGFSYSFTGWTALNSATLHVRTSTQVYVGFGADPDIYVERITSSWSEGTADSLSSSNAVRWDNQPSTTTTNRVTWDVSPSNDTWDSVGITALMQDAFEVGTFYGLRLRAIDETDSGETTEIWSREKGSSYRAYIVIDYSTNTAPNAPTSLTPTGSTVVHSLTPTFAGTFSDPNAGDTMSGYQVQVSTDSTFASVTHWDTTVTTSGATSFSIAYAGAASLIEGTTYYWRARTKDNSGAWGAYSAAQAFKVNSVPNTPTLSLTQSPTSDILTLTPQFNVTHNDPDGTDTKLNGYRIVLETSGGSAVWDSGEITVGTPVTTQSVAYGGVPALSWGTSYRWKAMTKDRNGAWSAFSSYATFTTHKTAVPVSLQPTGSATASSTAPTLTGSRGDTDDSLTSVQLEVYADDGVTPVWQPGNSSTGVSSTGFSRAVGVTLTAATYYKWRVRATSSIGGVSDWSALQRFLTPAATTPSQTSPLGTGITDTTPDLTFSRASSFNRHTLDLYSEDDNFTTPIWSDAPVAYVAVTSKAVTTGVTLTYGKRYQWRVRVSSDGGTNWSAYAGPSEFTMDKAGIPTLTAPINDSWQTTLTPTFTGSTFNAETIVTYRLLLDEDNGSGTYSNVWDSGSLAGSGTTFSKVYNGAYALVKGRRYRWRASYIKTGGIPGDYSGYQTFHINADPNAPTGLSPATGYVYADDASPVAPRFYADFSDSDRTAYGDVPTLFEVEVQRNSDGVQMYVLSRSASLNGGTNDMADGDAGVTKTVGAGGANLTAEITYKWRTRYTDSKAAVGTWSGWNTFKPSQVPTIAQTSPVTPLATVNSPSFLIDWTFSSPGAKAQQSYRVRLRRESDQVVVYDTGWVVSTTTQFTLPSGYLQNNLQYGVLIDTVDTDNLPSAQSINYVDTNWTAPDAPADFTATDDVARSAVHLSWTITSLSGADFSYYQIYRREPGDEDWTPYVRVTDRSTVSYHDYYAANRTTYDYMITVFKKVVGDVDLESVESDVSSVVLDSDAWYVVGADRTEDHIFELPVQRAPFREPVQQEVFEPLGSSRKTVVRGNVLGAEGTMELMFKEDEVFDARRRINYIKSSKGPHILKSPFGDVWEVEFSGPDKDYQMAGHMKVALAWTEVN